MVKLVIDGKETRTADFLRQNDEPGQSFPSFANDDPGITNISQPTELGESLKELNNDDVDEERASGIDLRSNLHPVEVPFILAVDSLVRIGVLPVSCLSVTRQKKRIAVSINALGRGNIVDMTSGKREHDMNASSGGLVSGFKNFFTRRGNEGDRQ